MKYKYSIDSRNQLFIRPPKEKVAIPVRGRFSIDKNNQLIYWLNEPASWRKKYDLPSRISFIGNWQLNPNYDLELNLAETKEQYKGERLILKGEIISIDRDTLVFEIISYDKRGLSHIQLLKLSGFWQADESNRIRFMLKKKTSPDILVLEGLWQMNRNQQIIYNYEKTDLKTKTKTSHTLTFEGFWEINSVDRLTYILAHSSQSRFDFRVQIESPNLYPQEGVIKYRLGIGLRQIRPSQNKIISLYGAWKFSRKIGLMFEMDYGKSKVHNIEFGTDISLSQKDKISFFLKDTKGKPLGLNITFTHRFLNKLDAETFLRVQEILKRESAIEAGVRIPF